LTLQKRKILNNTHLTEEQKGTQIKSIKYKNDFLEELHMPFYFLDQDGTCATLKEGDDILSINNIEEYLNLAADLFLSGGISKQIAALKAGFNEFFPVSQLKVFTVSELEKILCGTPESLSLNWTRQEIIDNAKFSSGFSTNSRAVQYLLNVLTSFSIEQRRSFLQFLTGSPRLPVGGWKGLRPQFTVHLKTLPAPDQHLPSVNTCFLFLKLPDYSSQQILQERLLYAMNNGQNAQFDFD